MTLNSKLFRDRKALKQKALPSKLQRKLPDRLSQTELIRGPGDPTTGSFSFVASFHTARNYGVGTMHFLRLIHAARREIGLAAYAPI
jgi:hypothetical protein